MAGAGLSGLVLVAAFNAATPAQAQPQPAANAAVFDFNIRAQSLGSALNALADRAGLRLLFPSGLVAGKQSPGLRGRFSPEQALSRLLAGTGLRYQFTNASTVTIVDPNTVNLNGHNINGSIPLDTIHVQNNHSRDIAATEHSTSYATDLTSIGSRYPVSIREIPQSISVVTQQRIQDQNLHTVEEALQNAPGITLNAASGGYNFDSRGFTITTITVDGMIENLDGAVSGPIDLAAYDRVEVLRGPAGLFNGSGNPGGSVNLARKRALDIFQIKANSSIGSWNRYRGEVDITGPLNKAKTVRGRFIAAGLDRDWFVDTFSDKRGLFYGTLEFDLSEATTLSIGALRQQQTFTPFFGLPAYTTGRFADVPRSTYLGANWNFLENNSTKYFVDFEHRFNNGAIAKISGRYSDAETVYRSAYGNALVSNVTPQWIQRDATNLSFDANVSLPFEYLQQQQNIVLGANYHKYVANTANRFGTVIGSIDIFNPNHDLRYPADSEYSLRQRSYAESVSYGVYGQARLKPVSWATFVLGGRLSHYESEDISRITVGAINLLQESYTNDNAFTPYAGVVVDLSRNISAYASYTSIFQPQGLTTFQGNLLPPIEGNQYEAGLTGSFFNKTLNTRVAIFRILRENAARSDLANPGFYVADGLARSQGFEAEVSGRILPNFDIAGSYTFTETRYLRADASNQDRPYTTLKPKHLVKVWSKYTFDNGPLTGFHLGAGLRWQSMMYVAGSGTVRWTQPAYAVVDLQAGYKLTSNVDVILSVTNLFDEHYFQTIGRITGNFYGEPRAYWMKISGKW